MLQAFFRTNTVLMGLPIAMSLFGEENCGQVSVLLAFQVPVSNVLAVIALELFRDGKTNFKHIFRDVVTNPFVIASVAGMAMSFCRVSFPRAIEDVINSIANAATPMALVLMGASLDFSYFKGVARSLSICVAERLIIAPTVFISLGALMGFRGLSLCTIMLVFATPVATNSYSLALQMDGDADLAGGIVILTAGAACLTLFLWIWLLKSIGAL